MSYGLVVAGTVKDITFENEKIKKFRIIDSNNKYKLLITLFKTELFESVQEGKDVEIKGHVYENLYKNKKEEWIDNNEIVVDTLTVFQDIEINENDPLPF